MLRVGTFVGHLPGTLATTMFGREIKRALEDPDSANYWISGVVVVAIVIAMVFARRWFGRRRAK